MTREEELDAMTDKQLEIELANEMEELPEVPNPLHWSRDGWWSFDFSGQAHPFPMRGWQGIGNLVGAMKEKDFYLSLNSGYPEKDDYEAGFSRSLIGDDQFAYDKSPVRAVVKAALLALSTK